MGKQRCRTLEECHENFEYNGKYDFLDHGYARFFGYCSKCDRRGFEIFEYQDYEFEKAEKDDAIIEEHGEREEELKEHQRGGLAHPHEFLRKKK